VGTMKNKILKLCAEHDWTFKGKTFKGWEVENNNKEGHVITSPTLEGLYRCMNKWIVNK
jgi:hypothetical protein